MKKLSLLFASLLLTTLAASAYPFYEPFSYPAGTNLIGQTNPDGVSWVQAGPTFALTNQPYITNVTLSYPGLAPSIGNSAQANGLTGTNGLAARFSFPGLVTKGQIYFSFLFKLTDLTGLSTSGVFWASFNNSQGSQMTVPTSDATRVVAKSNGSGGFLIGLDHTSGAATAFVFATNSFNIGDTVFVAGCYTFNGSGDMSQLWVNPDASTFSSGTAPTTNVLTSTAGGAISSAQIGSFVLFLDRNSGQPRGINMDELMISTNWAGVTPTNAVITSQPQSQRALAGNSATFTVGGYKIAGYQWQFYGTNLPGANSSSLTVANVQNANAGPYTVICTNGSLSVTSTPATLYVVQDTFLRLRPTWNIPPNTATYPYVTADASTTPNLRSIAYNALSNQIIVASRTNYITGNTNPMLYVLDAATGTNQYTLDTTIISGGSLSLTCVGVADDGAVYAVNETTLDTGNNSFHLYRWTNSASGQVGTKVFDGIVEGADNTPRWGDTMTVRGSGINTEVILDSNDGNWFTTFTPVDSTMASFQSIPNGNFYGTGSIGRSLQFGNTNSFYAKRHSQALQLATFDLNAFDPVNVLTNFSNFPSTVGPVGFPNGSNLLCGVDFVSSGSTPDTLDLFEISDMSLPLLLAKYNFPTNHQANANFIGQVLFVGTNVYALDANNGIVAYTLGQQQPTLSIEISGSNVIISWPTNATGYTLYSSPAVAPTTWTSAGGGTIVGSDYQVTSPISADPKFYRLQQ